MIIPSPDLTAERIESLKAGIFAGLCLTISYSITTLANHLLLAQLEQLSALQITSIISLGIKVATAFISGFLFGITYRYVIRQDDNSHLSEGAVLAFGIVRGLAPLEIMPLTSSSIWLLSVLGIESLIYFTLARFALDWAIRQHWLKPFNLN